MILVKSRGKGEGTPLSAKVITLRRRYRVSNYNRSSDLMTFDCFAYNAFHFRWLHACIFATAKPCLFVELGCIDLTGNNTILLWMWIWETVAQRSCTTLRHGGSL